jgi:deoxyribose-phosphate aldolase
MNAQEKNDLIQRLEKRYASGRSAVNAGGDLVQEALDAIITAGASRIGISIHEPVRKGFSACDLAPPIARLIDHTALKAETTEAIVRELCDEARKYCFASVCINPCYVRLAAELLRGTPVAVCTVIGFPLGATSTPAKAREAELAIRDGATEIDMVLNIGMLKSERYDYVEADVRAVVAESRAAMNGPNRSVITKVILETALLTDEEKVVASILAQNAGADFVKTSTGFSTAGATAGDVALMRKAVGPDMGVKASGGVRTREDAERMIAHGATRIGASASVAIVHGLTGATGY